MEVSDDSEVDLGLQAGRGADRHAGTLAFDAQVGFLHACHGVSFLLLLRGYARLRPPLPKLLLVQVQTQDQNSGIAQLQCFEWRWQEMGFIGVMEATCYSSYPLSISLQIPVEDPERKIFLPLHP